MPVHMPPRIETRVNQPYACITAERVPQPEINARLPPLLPRLFGALATRGVAPAGPPFFRYASMGHGEGMTVDVGVAVSQPIADGADLTAGSLPAGRYAALTYTGDYSGVHQANATLHDWVRANGFTIAPIDGSASPGAHLEFYPTDPTQEPDVTKWVTEVCVRLLD